MSSLVLVEHDHKNINSATLCTIAAAQKVGLPIDLLVTGSNVGAIASQAAQIAGIGKVFTADAEALANGLAENVAPVLVAQAANYSHLFANSTNFGKNILPRVAALLDVMQISDISAVIAPDTFERPIYAGNAIATVKSADKVKVITVRATKFDAAPSTGGNAAIEAVAAGADSGLSRYVSADLSHSEGPELATASIVVSGGRGMGSKENFFARLEPLAKTLNAAIGASRAAVDAGYCPNDHQVGQTGKVIAPDLYIAIGISGAIQHQAGMKDSKTIVAINKDPDAPIFQIADYGLVADLNEAVPALVQALAK